MLAGTLLKNIESLKFQFVSENSEKQKFFTSLNIKVYRTGMVGNPLLGHCASASC